MFERLECTREDPECGEKELENISSRYESALNEEEMIKRKSHNMTYAYRDEVLFYLHRLYLNPTWFFALYQQLEQ